MKNYLRLRFLYAALLTSLVLILVPFISEAQNLPPNPGVPIDGGILYLILGIFAAGSGSLLYVYRKTFKKKE